MNPSTLSLVLTLMQVAFKYAPAVVQIIQSLHGNSISNADKRAGAITIIHQQAEANGDLPATTDLPRAAVAYALAAVSTQAIREAVDAQQKDGSYAAATAAYQSATATPAS